MTGENIYVREYVWGMRVCVRGNGCFTYTRLCDIRMVNVCMLLGGTFDAHEHAWTSSWILSTQTWQSAFHERCASREGSRNGGRHLSICAEGGMRWHEVACMGQVHPYTWNESCHGIACVARCAIFPDFSFPNSRRTIYGKASDENGWQTTCAQITQELHYFP